jgi:uncharacterized protein (TIGR03435 family)
MSLQCVLPSIALVTLSAFSPVVLPAQQIASPAAATTRHATDQSLRFQVADIHASPYSFQSNYFHSNLQGADRYLFHQASLVDLVAFAYKLENTHIFGGPTWLNFNHYDITVKQLPSTPVNTARLMLRALLADRFKLTVHTDTRPMPAQILTLGRGAPKLKPAADTTVASDCQLHQSTNPTAWQAEDRADRPPAWTQTAPGSTPPSSYSFTCRNMTMAQYGEQIPRFGDNQHYPIVDQTGLKGAYDFDITYTVLPARHGLDVANDLEKIGLKLTLGQTPQPVLVIDSVSEKPTSNVADIDKLLPPPSPPAFEVAAIKPSPPDAIGDLNIFVNPSGEVRVTHGTLQRMIGEAYDISGAGIANIPDFLANDHWDIIAKVPQDAYPKGRNGSPELTYDDIQLMLRSLLAERFGMRAHFEDRPNATAWVLTAASPKLKPAADPTARTSCSDTSPPLGEKDPRAANPVRNRALWCHNVTMAQFASQIILFALDYIKSPVLDTTGIDGSYDIALNWSTLRVARGIQTFDGHAIDRANNAASGDAQAGDPSGAITLADAISKQLGLKLKQEKRPIPMLVIDHIDETPTPN